MILRSLLVLGVIALAIANARAEDAPLLNSDAASILKMTEAVTAQTKALQQLKEAEAQRGKTVIAVEKARIETLQAVVTSDQEGITLLRKAMMSGDESARRAGFEEAVKSGNWALQREAMIIALSGNPVISLHTLEDKNGNQTENVFTVTSAPIKDFDPKTGNFSGGYAGRAFNGSVSQGGIQIAGFRSCSTSLAIADDGVLRGVMTCGDENLEAFMRLF